MSHFTVLVIGDDVEAQLAPFHEFECTGENDQYVQSIDETEKVRVEFAHATTRQLRAPDGTLHSPYADAFYRDPTPEETAKIGPIAGTGGGNGFSWTSKDWNDGRGYRTKVRQVPDGYEEIEVARNTVESFAEFVEGWHGKALVPFGATPDLAGDHKYGYARIGENGDVVEVIDRTNPNAKWDWWTIGGRWSGFFQMKPGVVGTLGKIGVPEMFASDAQRAELAIERVTKADTARKGDIDFDRMRDAAEQKAGARWDKANAIIAGRSVRLWPDVRAAFPEDIEAARKAFWAQDVVRGLRQSADDELRWFENDDLALWLGSREQCVFNARCGAICTHAVVKDGQWYERGEMGWFAIVHDEKPGEQWERQFASLLDGLPDDTTLTVVDCHI